MSDKATREAEVRQDDLENGVRKHIKSIVCPVTRMYMLYRLEPLLSVAMFGYQREIAVGWFLFTEFVTLYVTLYDEVVSIIKALVCPIQSLVSAFHNKVIVHTAPKTEAPPTFNIPTITLASPSPPQTKTQTNLDLDKQEKTESANMAPHTLQQARQEGQHDEGTLESLRAKANLVFQTIFLLFFCMCYSYSAYGLIIFGLIWWMYSRRLEQKKTLQEGGFMSMDAEVVPFLVMWIVATTCGAILPAKIFLFTVLALVHEFHGTWLKERRRKVEREEWLRQTEHLREH